MKIMTLKTILMTLHLPLALMIYSFPNYGTQLISFLTWLKNNHMKPIQTISFLAKVQKN